MIMETKQSKISDRHRII